MRSSDSVTQKQKAFPKQISPALITNKPTEETTGYIHTTLGNYSLMTTEAALGGTIIDNKLLGRIAVKANKRDGYGENEIFGTDIDDPNQLSGRVLLGI